MDDDIPIKLEIIHALNLEPGILISKTRIKRKKLEHFYEKPTMVDAKEALDVADLFIRSIEGKFKMLTNKFGLTDEKIILVTYPLHQPHVAYLKISSELCDYGTQQYNAGAGNAGTHSIL